MGTAGAALRPQARPWGLQAPCPGSLKNTARPMLSTEKPQGEQPQAGRGQAGGKQHGWGSARALGETGRSSRAGADPSPVCCTAQGSVPERPHGAANNIPPLQPWPLPQLTEVPHPCRHSHGSTGSGAPVCIAQSRQEHPHAVACGDMNLREHKCHQPLGPARTGGHQGNHSGLL